MQQIALFFSQVATRKQKWKITECLKGTIGSMASIMKHYHEKNDPFTNYI